MARRRRAMLPVLVVVGTLLLAGGLSDAARRRYLDPEADGAAGYPAATALYRVDAGAHEPLPGSPLFLVVAGTDDRPGVSGARNDALHVVGVNPQQGAGTILNIPRDTYVDIPGHGRQKITAAHQLGGPQLLADTVAGLTGVHTPYVLTVNFAGFVSLVDAVGGVWVDIPYAVDDSASGAAFPAGRHLLSGDAALAYARARKTVPGGDFGRTENQGRLLLAALGQVRGGDQSHAATAAHVATLLSHVRAHGVALADLYGLARLALTVDPARVANVTMPGGTGNVGGQSVVFPGAGAGALFADFADDAVLGGP